MSDEVNPVLPPAVEVDGGDDEAALERLRAQRLGKVEALRREGIDPYPARYDRTHTARALREHWSHLEAGSETDTVARVAGRIMLRRGHGKLVFVTLRDGTGDLQLFVSRAELGEEAFVGFDDLDVGDVIGVEGTVMVTRKGELSVKARSFTLLAKSLRPLPDKWHGLSDVDARYRQRYVDLLVNEGTRRVFEIRSRTISAIRGHLEAQGFIEVETPVLSLIQGGAMARPFVTHYNALDLDTYLRIALELPLKRLVVGGLERVFELGRVFRNEGIDTRHNPEFTMLEAYQAYVGYEAMITLTEGLVEAAARAALGTSLVEVKGQAVDLAPPWRRVTMCDLIEETTGHRIEPAMSVTEARRVCDALGLEYEAAWGSGRLTHHVYDERAEPMVLAPTVVIDHPREVSPLAKPRTDDPTLVERFEVIVGGRELANAYSELNDPVEQLIRFEEGARAKAEGDAESGDVDLDYIRALEIGLPPTGGMGLGIDRLVMLLAGAESIREVILFPTLRPEQGLGRHDFPYAGGVDR